MSPTHRCLDFEMLGAGGESALTLRNEGIQRYFYALRTCLSSVPGLQGQVYILTLARICMASQSHTAARGYRLLRCPTCYLQSDVCICAYTPTIHTPVQFWLLMHPDEYRKPTNTARLIGASITHTRFFPWYRTAPPAGLIALLRDRRFMPYLLVPQGDATLFEGLRERPWLPGRVPAFVLLDGTWSQARKMSHRSPYLQSIPRLAIQPRAPSTYRLRCQRCAQHLSTVEVAIALLAQLDEMTASHVLHAYFRVFAERSLAARYGHPPAKFLPEMAQLLAYNSHAPQPAHGQSPLPLGEG